MKSFIATSKDEYLVKPYLVYPKDMPMYPEYELAVKDYMLELRQWYLEKVGKTFNMAPLKVIRSSYNYVTMRCGEDPAPDCIGDPAKLEGNWGMFMNKAIHNGVEKWEERTVALVFGAGGGGYAGANVYPNDARWAIVADWVLEPISGIKNDWGIPCSYSDGWQCSGGTPKGTPAHEIGHAFGLPHPDDYDGDSIMKWHGGYPEVGFLPHEIEILRKSPFFAIEKPLTISDTSQAQLQSAYKLIKAKKKKEANKLLITILKTDQNNVNAWWLLAHTIDNTIKQRKALEQVLRLQPNHQAAQSKLGKLKNNRPQKEKGNVHSSTTESPASSQPGDKPAEETYPSFKKRLGIYLAFKLAAMGLGQAGWLLHWLGVYIEPEHMESHARYSLVRVFFPNFYGAAITKILSAAIVTIILAFFGVSLLAEYLSTGTIEFESGAPRENLLVGAKYKDHIRVGFKVSSTIASEEHQRWDFDCPAPHAYLVTVTSGQSDKIARSTIGVYDHKGEQIGYEYNKSKLLTAYRTESGTCSAVVKLGLKNNTPPIFYSLQITEQYRRLN